MLFLPIAGLGLDRIVVRDLVREPEKENEIISTSIFMRFVSGFLSSLLSMAIIYFVRANDIVIFLMVFLFSSILLLQSLDVFDLWFQSKIMSKYVVIVKSIIFVVFSFLKIVILFVYSSLILYAALCAFENIFYAFGLVFVYLKKKKRISLTFNAERAYRMIKESYPLILSGLFVILSMKIGQIFIGQMISERELGIYSAATRITETTYIIITATAGSVFPLFSEIKGKYQVQYESMLEKFINFSGGIALIISIGITILAGHIIRIMYGIQYTDSIQILQIHICSTIPIFLSTAQGIWNINEGYTYIHFYQALCNAIITIISLIIFMPEFGIVGVAVISVVSPLVSTIAVNLFFKHTRRILWIQMRSLFVFRYVISLKPLSHEILIYINDPNK